MSHARLLGSRVQQGMGMGGMAAGKAGWLDLINAPTPQYIGAPDGPLCPRPISAPKPCPIRIQSSLAF